VHGEIGSAGYTWEKLEGPCYGSVRRDTNDDRGPAKYEEGEDGVGACGKKKLVRLNISRSAS